MRTDSTNLSATASAQIEKVIEKKYGKDQTEPRVYKTKSKNAQEAHEAIRPSHVESMNEGSNDEFTVYRIPTTKFSYDSAEVREAYISGKIPRNSRTTLSFIQPYADEGHTLREQFLRDYDLKKNASKAGFK
jgi:hypothetical protein